MTVPFAIDGRLCDVAKNVVLSADGVSLTAERPSDTAWVGVTVDHSDALCTRSLFEVEGEPFDVTPPARFDRVSELLGKRNPWALVHSSRKLWWATDKLTEASSLWASCQRRYHVDVFVPSSAVFASLTPWRVDPAIASCGDPMAASCLPGADGWLDPPRYNRLGTRTGRLTVTSGPRVLTVRQQTRGLFLPVDASHELVQFDFSALEARVALSLAGRDVPADVDPYAAIARISGATDRDEAKKATFTALYSDPTDPAGKDPRVAAVRRMFRLGETFSTLKRSLDEGGKARNFYGRPIPEPEENTLFNNYVQSTACDVTLMGFRSLLGGLSSLDVKPHFLVHDALFASVPRLALPEASVIASAGVPAPGFRSVFPIKATTVRGRPTV